MGNSQQVFQSIFNKSMFENGSKEFLAGIADEHPYFTAAQFYLLQKSEPGSDDYNKQLAKAAVLFNNPFWLSYQLEQSFGSVALPLNLSTDEVAEDEAETVQPLSQTGEISNQQVADSEPGPAEEISFEANTDFPMDNAPQVVDSSEITSISVHGAEIFPEAADETIEAKEMLEPVADYKTPAFTAEEITQIRYYNEGIIKEKTGEAIEDSKLETEATYLSPVLASTEIGNILGNNNENEGRLTDELIGNNTADPGIGNALTTPLPSSDANPSEMQNLAGNNPDEPGEEAPEKEIEPLRFTLNFTNATATTQDTIEFEPLHTSDYFASLGIKFSDEIKADDKLGKHLKSFTEWLKTMKKIHPDQLPQQSAQSETIIQQMAEKSNTEGEVLTEAMAEVLLQQGKLGKAIEVYQKLSLLNPLKSAYFAAKIDKIER